VGLRRFGGFPYLLVGRVEPPVPDVLGDGAVEEERVLAHVPDRLPQIRDDHIAHVVAVHADRPIVDIVQPQEELRHR